MSHLNLPPRIHGLPTRSYQAVWVDMKEMKITPVLDTIIQYYFPPIKQPEFRGLYKNQIPKIL